MRKTIAVCGKGGVGKTTFAALLARLALEKPELKTLVIDADPTGGLSMALKIPVRETINDLRREVISQLKERRTDSGSLAAAVDYRLLDALTEYKNLALLAVGRPEEEGCFCEVNSFLRQSIGYLREQFDLTIVDAEAGVEQVNRRVLKELDLLLLVSDISLKGISVAESVREISLRAMECKDSLLLINRLKNREEYQLIKKKTSLKTAGWLPENQNIRRYDSEGLSFLDFPLRKQKNRPLASLEDSLFYDALDNLIKEIQESLGLEAFL